MDPEKTDFLIGDAAFLADEGLELGDAAFLADEGLELGDAAFLADDGLELRPELGGCFSVSAGTGDCG